MRLTSWLLLMAGLGCSPEGASTQDATPPSLPADRCVELANEEIRCPYHALDPARHNVVYLDTASGAVRAADINQPTLAQGDVILDPFVAEYGWTPGVASASPDGQRILIWRLRQDCPPWTGSPGPGLDCSYGRPTLWLAAHEGDAWIHTNLTKKLLGRNSEIHGWTTWLHNDLALFNAVVFPDDGGWYDGPAGYDQAANAAQIYEVRFAAGGAASVGLFAPAQLHRPTCLTGRVFAQPSSTPGACFAGQRLTIVRRCYSEPLTNAAAWAWWNTRGFDGAGGPCLAQASPIAVPVLRTYVVELDAACTPTRRFEDLVAVREPPDDPIYRQMGIGPEWGDMLSAVSPDGQLVAFSTNMGDPGGDLTDACAGFRYGLADPANPMSGMASRRAHVCQLGPDKRCAQPAVLIGTERTPPEGTPLPGFVRLGTGSPALVFTRQWGVLGEPPGHDIHRVDLALGPNAHVPLAWGHEAVGIVPYYGAPSPPDLPAAGDIVLVSGPVPGAGSPALAEIYMVDIDGSHPRRVTTNDQQEFLPHFSPDGRRLVFTRFLTGDYGHTPWDTDVIVYDFATGTEQNLTHRAGNDSYPVWSPDGTRIAFVTDAKGGIQVMNADGSGVQFVPLGLAGCCADLAWSSDDWILSTVAVPCGSTFKSVLYKFRPDGSGLTQVSDGGPSCTPAGMEVSGDADPGFSPDGRTIYSSRGFPWAPAGLSPPATERRLFAFSSEAWFPGKPEYDLSLPSQPSCIEGVPKASPDGARIILFRVCFDVPNYPGIYLTDTSGSFRTRIADGFGADWHARARQSR